MGYRIVFLLLMLSSIALTGQAPIPSDVLIPRLWGTGFTFARPVLYGVHSAENFHFLLSGSNSDYYKALPHTHPLAATGRYFVDSFSFPLIQRQAPPRDYPYIRISQNPQVFQGSSWISLVTHTFGSRLHIFNFYQNSSSFFPEPYAYNHLPALSQNLNIDQAGGVSFLATSVDGLSTDTNRTYNENGMDNDSLFLLAPNYAKRDFDTLRIIRQPVEVDAPFTNYLGPFDYNPDTEQLRYFRRNALLIYERNSIWPDTIIACPSLIKLSDLKQMERDNYQFIRFLQDSAGAPAAIRLLHWRFRNKAFEVDSFEIALPTAEFWPEEEDPDYPWQLHWNPYIDSVDQDMIIMAYRLVMYDTIGLSTSYHMIKLNRVGELIWTQRFSGAEFPASIETMEEVNDTLIFGGSYFPHYPFNTRVSHRWPYFRRLDPQGRILEKNTQVLSQDHLEIYPNPFRVDFHLEALGLQEIELLDQSGRLIRRQSISESEAFQHIYWPDLETGTYYLRLHYLDGRQICRRLMKLPF